MKRNGFAAVVVILIVVIILVAAGGIWYYGIHTQAPPSVQIPEATSTASVYQQTSTATYRNTDYGFQVQYSGSQFKERPASDTLPPDWKTAVTGTLLAYTPEAPSGTTCLNPNSGEAVACIYPGFGFYGINQKFSDIVTHLGDFKDYGGGQITIGGHQGVYVDIGAENEGVFWYFISTPDGRTVAISRSYANAEERYGSTGLSKTLFDQMIATFKFNSNK